MRETEKRRDGEAEKGRGGEAQKRRNGETEKRGDGAPEMERARQVSSGRPIKSYRDLEVYKMAMDGAVRIFELTKSFPVEERFSLVDQVRRSSRSVATNIAEAWRKRRYEAAFVSKLSDAETEAAETQVWAEMALRCGYWQKEIFSELDVHYDNIIGKLVRMIDNPRPWLIVDTKNRDRAKQ